MECPACRKENQAGPDFVCRRCGCDLGRLYAVMVAAEHQLRCAAESLRQERWEDALVRAERSWRLRHTPDAARLAFLASCALGDDARLARWRDIAS